MYSLHCSCKQMLDGIFVTFVHMAFELDILQMC